LRAAAAPVEGTAVCDEVPLAEAPVDEAAPVEPEVPVVLEPVAVPVELVLVPVTVIRVLVVEVPVVVPEVEALEEVLVLVVLEVEELWAEPVTLNCSDWARIPVLWVTSDWRLTWKPDLYREEMLGLNEKALRPKMREYHTQQRRRGCQWCKSHRKS
jgi:hypothetical protein